MAEKRDVDWGAVKLAYIEGDDTWAQLAKRFGVTQGQVQYRARRERWRDTRDEVRAKASEIVDVEQAAKVLAARHLQQQAELDDAFHGAVLKQIEAVETSKDPTQQKTRAITLGIMMDKRHQELERTQPKAEGMVEETYSRRQWTLGQYRQAPEDAEK